MFKVVHRIINFMGKYKKNIYLGMVFSLIESMLAVVPLGVVGGMLYAIYQDKNGTLTIGKNEPVKAFSIILASIVLRIIFHYLKAITQSNTAYKACAQERLNIGEKIKKVPLGFFTKTKTGKINAVLTTELSFFEMFAMNIVDMVFNSYVFLIIMIIAFFTIDPILAVIVLGSLMLSILGLSLVTKVSDTFAPERQEIIGTLTDVSIEYIRGMSVVKSYNKQGVTSGNYVKACDRSRDMNTKYEKIHSFYNFFFKFGLYLGIVGVIYGVAIMRLNDTLSMEMWIILTLYSFVMFANVEAWDTATVLSAIASATLDNVAEITDTEDMEVRGSEAKLNDFNIRFNNVHFSYDTREVIKGVNLEIPQGSSLAIVGPSGSGKSTLCNLLTRFYDVTSGEIKIGGTDIRNFKMDNLLENISVVFQKVYLFEDTIENNIKFGKPDATREEVIEVAKKAKCHDFIINLDHGYETVIGEGGGTLSGGEKQRISIARAMLKDANIVILDEATANIDPENEFYIQQAISELVKGKTVIIIAHKLATIEHADNIIVIDDGQIVQSGNHNKLSKEDGIYKEFIELRKNAESWSI